MLTHTQQKQHNQQRQRRGRRQTKSRKTDTTLSIPEENSPMSPPHARRHSQITRALTHLMCVRDGNRPFINNMPLPGPLLPPPPPSLVRVSVYFLFVQFRLRHASQCDIMVYDWMVCRYIYVIQLDFRRREFDDVRSFVSGWLFISPSPTCADHSL